MEEDMFTYGRSVKAVIGIICIILIEAGVSRAENVKLEKIVVTPSRYEESGDGISKNVTVLTEEDIKGSNAKSVPDLLSGECGIVVKDMLGNGKTAQVDIRGFGESSPQNTLVLIDGRRTNQIDLSGTDWTQINLDSIERIEVVRGPQSVLYGDNAVGGVINIITKKGAGKKPSIGLSYKAGTFDYSSYGAMLEGGSDFLDYYAGFQQTSTDGHRLNNNLETIDSTGSIITKPTHALTIKTDCGYHKDWYGLPGALSAADFNTMGWKGSTSPNNKAKTEDYYIMAGPEYDHAGSSGSAQFSCDTLVRGRRVSSLYYYPGSSIKRTDHIKTFGLTPKVSIENKLLSMINKFLVGIDYYANKDSIASASGAAITNAAIERRTLGVYATDTIDVTPFISLNAGGRIERAHFRFEQGAVNGTVTTRNDTEYAVEAGINYKFTEGSSLYANYGRSYRLPAVDEWFSTDYVYAGTLIAGSGLNTDLVPQTGNHFEVGVRQDTLKYFTFDVDYFMSYLKHEIYYNPLTYANSIYDTTLRHGMEIEAHFRPTGNLDAYSKYTYIKAIFLGSAYAGNEIPGVPRDKVTFGINYTFRDCVRLNYSANIVGPQFFVADIRNSNPELKLYATHDLKLSYYKYGFSAYIGMYNLTDMRYSSYGAMYGTEPYYFPAPGRNVTLGVEYKF
jgi:iron complex outermembrane receptor protein